MKKMVAVFVCVFFILSSQSVAYSLSLPSWVPYFGTDVRNMDGSFATIYPPSFWGSSMGKWTMILIGAVVTGVVTYFTLGTGTAAAAGPIAVWIGSVLGGLKGLSGIAAINAGLAMLGGGAVASGWFGIFGGLIVLNVIGDMAIGIALESVVSRMPGSVNHDFLNVIKLKMFSNLIDKDAQEIMADLEKELGKTNMSPDNVQWLISRVEGTLTRTVEPYSLKTTEKTAYNWLLLAIISYNNEKFDEARTRLTEAHRFFKTDTVSVVAYVSALLYLVDGAEGAAINDLERAISLEPDAIPPYIVLAQIHIDKGDFFQAERVLKSGLSDADDDDFAMNLMLGNVSYQLKKYDKAITYYKEALSNMTVNELEATCKLSIAKSYKKMGDTKKALSWLDDAVDEVSDKPELVKRIREEYFN